MALPSSKFDQALFVFDPRTDELACLTAANNSPAVQTIDAQTTNLARNWRPTGFYTLTDIKGILDVIDQQTLQAQIQLSTTLQATGDAPSMIRQAQFYLDRNKQRSAGYRALIADAQKRGLKIVDAPGLKDFVLKSMVNISQAFVTKAAIECRANWLDKGAAAASAIANVAGKVVGAVADTAVAAGKAAIDAAAGAAKGFGTVLTVLKWTLIIGGPVIGGLWAFGRWNEYVAKQRALRSESETIRIAAVERSAAQREQARIAKALKAQPKAQAKAMKTPKAEPSALPPAAELISPVVNS